MRLALRIVLTGAALAGISPAGATETPPETAIAEQAETALSRWDMAEAGRLARVATGDVGCYLRSVVANRENRLAESARLLRGCLPALARSHPALATPAGDTLYGDYLRSGAYRRLYAFASDRLRSRAADAKPEEMQGLQGDLAMAEALRNAPATTVDGARRATLRTYVNALGTRNVDLSVNGVVLPWMIDTGANFSILSESSAKAMKLDVVDVSTTAVGSTGAKSGFRIAIVKELAFGSVTLRNVVAMVVADEALVMRTAAGPQKIQAALGYQALAAFGRFTMTRAGAMTVEPGAPPLASGACLYMNQLFPLLEAEQDGVPLIFTIDTGASMTTFNANYLERFRAQSGGWVHKRSTALGMGGQRTSDVLIAPSVTLRVADRPVTQTDVAVGQDDRAPPGLYGNLGQPLLRDAGSYTFDFRSMHFAFGDAAGSPGR